MTGRAPQPKPQTQQAQPEKARAGFYVVKVVAETPIIYGRRVDEASEAEREELVKRYGEEKAKHIDYMFMRAPHPITNEWSAYIPGWAVLAALKSAAGIGGKPLPLKGVEILGIYFPLKWLSILTHLIGKPGKEPVLMMAEAINPGAEGQMIWLGDPAAIPNEIKVPTAWIGRARSKGYGKVQIRWE